MNSWPAWRFGPAAARIGASVALVASVTLLGAAAPAASGSVSSSPPAACTAPPVTTAAGTGFNATETLCRWFTDTGTLADQRSFSVSVSNTTDLLNRQVVSVSWTGAHPSSALVGDLFNAAASNQQYPVVLMECRGVDSATAPKADQISPETCWTATPEERTAGGGFGTPLWSEDIYNSPANQATDVNANTSFCPQGGPTQYWVPFAAAAAAGGYTYDVAPQQCDQPGNPGDPGVLPPEMVNVSVAAQSTTLVPSDTTYAITGANGQGSDNFSVATADANASLGCSSTVPCSLVIIPIEGISCSSSASDCEDLGAPPEESAANVPNRAASVTGNFWWTASNWQRRISVPLHVASPAPCSTLSANQVNAYGSHLMSQATGQWNRFLCGGKQPLNVSLVDSPEPTARQLLQSGGIDAAVQAVPPVVPPGQKSYFTTPTVQAPVALSGFAIAYEMDNADGQPYTELKLDPRLLAKLMTESYPNIQGTPSILQDWEATGAANCTSGCNPAYAALATNPATLFDDPEFKALNPGYTPPTGISYIGAETLFSILSQSDVVWSLTSYINSDPAARSWLDGQPDPWGMAVNPAYKGISLPISTWPLLDRTTNGPDYLGGPFSQCVAPQAIGAGNAPPKIPERPLIDNPVATLAQVAYNLQYAILSSFVNCVTGGSTNGGGSLQEGGSEQQGFRFLLGIVSLADAEEFNLQTASLQTYVSPGAPSKFTDGSDRVFAAPSDTSLRAAAALLAPDNTAGSWRMPYQDFTSNPSAADAYPGTMLLSMDVPTQGLAPNTAQQLGSYLAYAASSGQSPGVGAGQLPSGYLPLTSANGMVNEAAYTQAAAADVTQQNGQIPPLVPGGKSPGNTTSSKTTSTSAQGTGTGLSRLPNHPSNGTFRGPGSETQSNSQAGAFENNKGKGQAANVASVEPAAQVGPSGRTLGLGSGLGGLALPLASVIATLGAVLTVTFSLRRRRRTEA